MGNQPPGAAVGVNPQNVTEAGSRGQCYGLSPLIHSDDTLSVIGVSVQRTQEGTDTKNKLKRFLEVMM